MIQELAQGLSEGGFMIREVERIDISECVSVIRDSFKTVADEFGLTEENQVLRHWYEQNGVVHIGTKKYDFFPFTCGYMKKEI